MILNLGCGNDLYGDIRCDIVKTTTVNVVSDAEHLPFRDEIFDKVYSRCVFEHMPNAHSALKEQLRVLKMGGAMELITDNAGYWRFHILGIHTKPRIKSKWIQLYRGRRGDKHYALFTAAHMENHLSNFNLEIQSMSLGVYGFLGYSWLERLLSFVPLLKNMCLPRIRAICFKKRIDEIPDPI